MLSPDVFFVTVVLNGLGLMTSVRDIKKVTYEHIAHAVTLLLDLAERPEYEPDRYAVMQALHDRGFTRGAKDFALDHDFGPKAKEALQAYLATAANELGV